MRRLLVLIVFIASPLFASDERWCSGKITEDGTATTHTAYNDADNDNTVDAGEAFVYPTWIVCNGDTVDYLHVNVRGNTAVNDGSRPNTTTIHPSTCRTFDLKTPRSTISAICDTGQTCADMTIEALTRVQ